MPGFGLGVGAPALRAREVKLRVAIFASEVMHVIGSDDGQLELSRTLEKDLVEHRLLDQVVVLQLDEERPWLERALHAIEHGEPRAFALLEHLLRHDAAHTPGERHEPARIGCDRFPGEARRRIAGWLDLALGNEANEGLVAFRVLGQQNQVIDRRPPALAHVLGACDVDLTAEDGNQIALATRLVELKRAEHIGVVGHRDAAHAELADAIDQRTDAEGAVQERILRVDMKVDEFGHRSPIYTTRRHRARRAACFERWRANV
jgi:hypothetical protein